MKNNKTRFFYVLYAVKEWIFAQSERAYVPIYIIKTKNIQRLRQLLFDPLDVKASPLSATRQHASDQIDSARAASIAQTDSARAASTAELVQPRGK